MYTFSDDLYSTKLKASNLSRLIAEILPLSEYLNVCKGEGSNDASYLKVVRRACMSILKGKHSQTGIHS